MNNLLDQIELKIITDDEIEPFEVQMMSSQLLNELLDTDIDDAEYRELVAPDGSKVGGAIDWHTLALTLSASSTVLVGVFGVLRSWMERNRGTKLTLALANGSSLHIEGNLNHANVQEIISAFQSSAVQQGGVTINVNGNGMVNIAGDVVGRDQKVSNEPVQ